jgi:hypothetical protein
VICKIVVVVLEGGGKEERLDQGGVGHCGSWRVRFGMRERVDTPKICS